MKKEDLIKRIELLEKRIDEMAKVIPQTKKQERELIKRCGEIDRIDFNKWLDINNKRRMFNLFSELKYIEEQWNEGKEFDWQDEKGKHTLQVSENEWQVGYYWLSSQIFNFHTLENARLFLKTFSKELEIIKPLFS